MTPYSAAIEFLYSLRWYGAKFGLDNTFKLAALAGNPQNQLRFIHAAGTNGKGSTCAMLESIYRAAGLRVGLFTSPHLVGFGERIQVNRRNISPEDIARLVAEMRVWLEEGWGAPASDAADNHPTFFEVVTVMALRYFAAQRCDLVIWETGLGGRLDSTNIVTPLASVITNIQYDHQKYLGETLASIATEKAGIIKPGVLLITGTEAPDALEVIAATARQRNATLKVVQSAEAHQPPLDTIRLPLPGEHQRMNAAVALATVRALASQLPLTDENIRAGLEGVYWPGRLQLVKRPSGQRILLDGAHNLGGAEALAAALREFFPYLASQPKAAEIRPHSAGNEGVADCARGGRAPQSDIRPHPTLILGILRDKDWPGICELLAPLAGRILLVPVHSERTAEPHGLAEVCHGANPQAQVSEHPSLAAALSQTNHDDFVTIAGSLYLIGEAMELLELSPAKANGERGLNEWSEPAAGGSNPGSPPNSAG